MPECSFCKKNYTIPRGLTYVLESGAVLHFCSSKCQKNKKLGRKGEKTNWVRKKGKEVKMEEEKTVKKVEVKKK